MVKCCGSSKYNARQLREAVTFQRRTQTGDGAGGYTETFAAISGAPTRAMVKPLSGRERWASNRVEASANYRVVTRYYDGLTEKDVVVIRGRTGNIRFIANVDLMDEWLEIDVDLGAAI
jgi:SPP1 family predicted phage head-tail adaptor